MKFFSWIKEMISTSTTGLRSVTRFWSGSFFGPRPLYDKTSVDYELARQLYRNDGSETSLGAGFCAPIIDTAVEFIDLPIISSDNEERDADVNKAIQTYWAPQIGEMLRNAMRDSKTWVRVWQPRIDDPLTADEERRFCALEIIDPERVRAAVRDPQNPRSLKQIVIVTYVDFVDPVQPVADPPRGAKPQVKEHEIWEIITPTEHRYYDKTDNRWLDDWKRANPYGFVPALEIFNEYDSTLSGGQSDLESVYPFIKAFHEVMRQSLQAHAYHSMPKLKFKVRDFLGFLRNNFPTVLDPTTGEPMPGAAIPWRGREVLFIGENEEIDTIEITSILGDSKVLLEFLIDCISISSETPEWAFMRIEGGTSQGAMNAQTVPFEKKIERKRRMFQEPVQVIVKMMLAINNQIPERVEVTWPEIRIESLASVSQAMQQLMLSIEVALDRRLISDNTAREALRMFRIFRKMKTPQQEATDAGKNFVPALPPVLSGTEKSSSTNGKGKNPVSLPARSGRNGGGAGN